MFRVLRNWATLSENVFKLLGKTVYNIVCNWCQVMFLMGLNLIIKPINHFKYQSITTFNLFKINICAFTVYLIYFHHLLTFQFDNLVSLFRRPWHTSQEVPLVDDEQTPWKLIKLLKSLTLCVTAILVFGFAICSKVCYCCTLFTWY